VFWGIYLKTGWESVASQPAVKSKDTDGLLQKNGQNHCRPSVPDKHPHACFITRTLNEVIPKLGAEGVWMLRLTCELPVNGTDLHPGR
jgi:hypothetical protein